MLFVPLDRPMFPIICQSRTPISPRVGKKVNLTPYAYSVMIGNATRDMLSVVA
jgi:hypothetical protein